MLAALLADASALPPDADPDSRIRTRLHACREGMAQLDALRDKHTRLMECMRVRLPALDSEYAPFVLPTRLPVAEEPPRIQPPVREAREPLREPPSEPPPRSREPASPPRPLPPPRSPPKIGPRTGSAFTAVQPTTIIADPIPFSDSPLLLSSSPSSLSPPGVSSHRSSISIDSGCGVSIASSNPEGNQPEITPYATYRKISIEARGGLSVEERLRLFEQPQRPPRSESLLREKRRAASTSEDDGYSMVASTIEATTAMRAPSMRRLGRIERPRSMFEQREEEDERKEAREKEAYRNSTLERSFTTRTSGLIDSMSFSQITPPPVQRKFGVASAVRPPAPPEATATRPHALTVNKTPPGAPGITTPSRGAGIVFRPSPPQSTSSPSTPQNLTSHRASLGSLTLSSSAASGSVPRSNSSSHIVPLKTALKAEITPRRDVQRAQARIPTVQGIYLATPTRVSDASRTPPTKMRSRPLSLHELKVSLTPDEEIEGIFQARPAKVLSRQSSSSSSSLNSNSPPTGNRKVGVVQPPTSRFLASCQSQLKRSNSGASTATSSSNSSRTRLEKMWRESEGL